MSDVAVHTRALVAGPDAKAARTAVTSVERSATAITLTWLVRLRWGFFLAQAVTVVAARYVLAVDVPIAALAGVVATSGFSNLALDLWSRKRRDPHQSVLGGVFVLDTLLLTALVYFSGGPANPFSVFYLVHVTIAAVALGMRWAGVVVVLSVLSYATLFFEHVNVPAMEHAHHSGTAFSVHLQGMWFALTIAASLGAMAACTSSDATSSSSGGSCPEDLPAACPAVVPSYAKEVAPVIEQACTPCHAPGGEQANRKLVDYAGAFANRSPMLNQVHACRMPPANAPPLGADGRKVLLTWLVCGAPNN